MADKLKFFGWTTALLMIAVALWVGFTVKADPVQALWGMWAFSLIAMAFGAAWGARLAIQKKLTWF